MIPSLDASIFNAFFGDALRAFWPIVAVIVGIWLGFRIFSMVVSAVSRSPAPSDSGDEEGEEYGD